MVRSSVSWSHVWWCCFGCERLQRKNKRSLYSCFWQSKCNWRSRRSGLWNSGGLEHGSARLRICVLRWGRATFWNGLLSQPNEPSNQSGWFWTLRITLYVRIIKVERAHNPQRVVDICGWSIDEKNEQIHICTNLITKEILRELKIPIDLVDEGLVAKTMLEIYENQSIIVEPAGALAIAGLELRKN